MTDDRPPFRWTERRTARLVTILLSAAVVVADLVLFFVFIRMAGALPGGWGSYWYIPAGIAGVFLFATGRLVRQIRLFRRDE
jgi:hypothetical protein